MRTTRITDDKIQQFQASDWKESTNKLLDLISTLNQQIQYLEDRLEKVELERLEEKKSK